MFSSSVVGIMETPVSGNLSQDKGGSQDLLLDIFGSGRLTGSNASHCSPIKGILIKKSGFGREPHTQLEEPASNQTTSNHPKHQASSRPSTRRQTSVEQSACNDVESYDGSMDLFNSQLDQASLLDENIDITLQLTEFDWVQCDNSDCQKWRRIPAKEANELGEDPWYCFMSSDQERNTCAAPEEDHAMYDRIAKKAGIKYVMSMLGVGSLVWAKMTGYCRWPALVTRDPQIGCHVVTDLDGDAYTYHVEFLGKSHSHSWVAAKYVEVYGHKTMPRIEESQSQTMVLKRARGGCKGHQKRFSTEKVKRKHSYKNMHIDAVIKEADFLLVLNPEERLQYTVFKYDPLKHIKQEEKEMKKDSQKCFQCKSKEKKHRVKQAGKERLNQAVRKILTSRAAANNLTPVTRKAEEPRKKKIKTGKTNRGVFDYTSDGSSYHEISLDEGISVKTVRTESVFDSPDQFSQSQLKFMNPMQDKTKQEKFNIDIDMYRKNEAAFEHDVRRFMSRNGQKIRNTPIWHTVPVTLFQLYLAVHERGGFDLVNKKKQWSAVYKEITEQQHVNHGGTLAKKYYRSNLYPYELYITGKDYETVFTERKKNKSKIKENKKIPSPVNNNELVDHDTVLIKENNTSLSQDIEAILDRLEEDYSPQANHTSGVKPDIRFHDDNTDSSQAARKVPSEFHASLDSGDVQEVPSVGYSGDGLSDIQEKILHEMKALEDNMKEISELGET